MYEERVNLLREIVESAYSNGDANTAAKALKLAEKVLPEKYFGAFLYWYSDFAKAKITKSNATK